MRAIDADAFCGFLREVSTRQHYETLLTKKDRYPTVADVIEEICCDLDGTSLNGFGNCPTVEERPKGKWIIDGHHIRCNRCNEYICNTDREDNEIPDNFCPNCGADMRGDV